MLVSYIAAVLSSVLKLINMREINVYSSYSRTLKVHQPILQSFTGTLHDGPLTPSVGAIGPLQVKC